MNNIIKLTGSVPAKLTDEEKNLNEEMQSVILEKKKKEEQEQYQKEKKCIEEQIGNNPIFVLDNQYTELWHYIDYQHDTLKLADEILTRIKICKEFLFNKSVTLYSIPEKFEGNPENISELLKKLNPGTRYQIVIEDNNRTLLANLIQQLIYIDYPITELDFKLRKEYKDAAKIERLMKRIDVLKTKADTALNDLQNMTINANTDNIEELYEYRAHAIAAYKKIQEQLQKARNIELKIAIAATKKTGKSVIANSLFGMELAPTSNQLATPNNCIYKCSNDSLYHLKYGNKMEEFKSQTDLFNKIFKEFTQAQKEAGSIEDMEIYYPSNKNNFESYTIYDTPGPDYIAGNAENNNNTQEQSDHANLIHQDIAKRAVNECDVAVFAFDYSKYLTQGESSYLKLIKDIFAENNKFHTLLFVINKVDLEFQDGTQTRSRIKTIDYIRTQIRNIDSRYKDCIIFATSALTYFNTLELKNAVENNVIDRILLAPDTNLYEALNKILCNSQNTLPPLLIPKLTELIKLTCSLKFVLNYDNLSINALQNYSGFPQFMSYLEYIAKSKARNEIVNNIASIIDIQCKNLDTVMHTTSNIEELIGKNQDELNKITKILQRYLAEVEQLLNVDITSEDYEYFKSNANDTFFSRACNKKSIREQKCRYP